MPRTSLPRPADRRRHRIQRVGSAATWCRDQLHPCFPLKGDFAIKRDSSTLSPVHSGAMGTIRRDTPVPSRSIADLLRNWFDRDGMPCSDDEWHDTLPAVWSNVPAEGDPVEHRDGMLGWPPTQRE